jgi:hypothetical protein
MGAGIKQVPVKSADTKGGRVTSPDLAGRIFLQRGPVTTGPFSFVGKLPFATTSIKIPCLMCSASRCAPAAPRHLRDCARFGQPSN